MKSRYTLITMDRSFCPTCQKTLHLLTPPDSGPSFYICFNGCKFIGEVGVGPVEKER